jgi:hypothetical protein
MDKGQAIRRRVLRQLDEHGWRRIRVASLPGHSWLTEVWTLESVWLPSGLRAYLVFLTNPGDPRLVTVHVSETEPHVGWIPPGEEDWPWRYEGMVAAWELRYGGFQRRSAAVVEELTRWRDANVSPPPGADAARSESENHGLTCTDAARLLHQLRDRLSERKLRLFTCACLRHLGHVSADERNLQAVEAAEQYADRRISKRELKKARKAANIPWLTSFEPYHEAMSTIQAAALVTTAEQQRSLCDLLRDVAGHLWQPVTLRPSWLRRSGGIVAAIARTIYADHLFVDLPILADALEEAGCDNTLILNHCRQPGEHVRGCWVLDLLLGKQ